VLNIINRYSNVYVYDLFKIHTKLYMRDGEQGEMEKKTTKKRQIYVVLLFIVKIS
jgi:hypothetical protein